VFVSESAKQQAGGSLRQKRKIEMSNRSDMSSVTCGCYILVMVINLFVGGWSVNYLLQFFLEKTVSPIAAALIGLIVGEVSIPVAIVVAILKSLGVL
jgi:hypothetical protein